MEEEHPFLSLLALDAGDHDDSNEWFADRMRCKDGANIFAKVVRALCKIAPECIRSKRPFVTCSQIVKRFRIDRRQVHEMLNRMVDHGFMRKVVGYSRGEHRYFFQGGDIGYLHDHRDENCVPVLLCEENRAVIKEVLGRDHSHA